MNSVNIVHYLLLGEKCDTMLVVGTVSSAEEQKEVHFIAEVAIVGNRIRYLARQQTRSKE